MGDCIDCGLCVAVCPTGVDIRHGQQFGCITCGLCIDACDSVMEKIKKPKGLIRYASLQEFAGKPLPPMFKRPRVIVYSSIMAFAGAMLIWGLLTMAPLDLKALHDRSPLYVQMSNGNIQNKWTLKIVNKGNEPIVANVTVKGPEHLTYEVNDEIPVQAGNVGSTTLFVQIPRKHIDAPNIPIEIFVQDINNAEIKASYDSTFIAPKPR